MTELLTITVEAEKIRRVLSLAWDQVRDEEEKRWPTELTRANKTALREIQAEVSSAKDTS